MHTKYLGICYQNSSKKTKRPFDCNGMNSLSIISCKDTNHGAQLTLIDKKCNIEEII